jgi:hypothetical protein
MVVFDHQINAAPDAHPVGEAGDAAMPMVDEPIR